MSFYVTLPSHSADVVSEYGKEVNSQTDFTIKLKRGLNLPINKYEVSLVEMGFKNSWDIRLGKFQIKDRNKTILFDEDIFIYDGLSLKQVCRSLNEKFKVIDNKSEIVTKEKLSRRFTNDMSERVTELEDKLRKHLDLKNSEASVTEFLDLSKVMFLYIESNNISIYVPEGFTLTISGYFAQLCFQRINSLNHNGLLFSKIVEKEGDTITKQLNPNEFSIIGGIFTSINIYLNFETLKYIEQLYVYTDIIEDTYIGEDMKRLLRIVQVKQPFDNFDVVSYSDPHYVPLENDYFDSIRMIVKDGEGNNIKFKDNHAPVIYKLHFRAKKY
jgi:hypothetical protein